MNILIITHPGDIHAHAVCWRLETLGHDVQLWISSDFPSAQTISFAFENGTVEHSLFDNKSSIRFDHFDRVWMRRLPRLQSSEDLHPADRDQARNESDKLRRSALYLMGEDAIWINPLDAIERGENKPYQLTCASRAGLNVPDTIIGNDPDAIRQLFQRHDGHIIYKPIKALEWKNADANYLIFTSQIDESLLQDDVPLRLCPGIYQENLPKAYEVRANIMGNTVLSIALSSQVHEATKQDWRLCVNEGVSLPAERISLPDDIFDACLRLMKSLGIVFGAFDFIVTPDGTWYFLEVNVMGQFLWVEQNAPECPILQAFADFLVSEDPATFIWDETVDNGASYAAYKNSDAHRAFQANPIGHHLPMVQRDITDENAALKHETDAQSAE